jgi:hypothetical protein
VAVSTLLYDADHDALLADVNASIATFRFINRAGNLVDSFTVAPAK